jgi:hypothetical protein
MQPAAIRVEAVNTAARSLLRMVNISAGNRANFARA